MGFTLSQLESYRPSGVKLPPEQDIATHILSLHIGAEESVQSSEEEHVVTTVFVTAMTLPVRGTVNDMTAGSKVGAVETHVPL